MSENSHYLDRITSQHQTKPKFMAWLAAVLEKAEDSRQFLQQIESAFNLDDATGKQLDIIGQWVGVSRLLNFEPVYAEPLLSDEYYRMVIKAKISLNRWDGTVKGILELWSDIFHGYTLDVVDHQDMSMTLRISNLSNLFESEFISRGYLAPKPMTVRVHYEFVMRSDVLGDYYVGSAAVAETVVDTLGELFPSYAECIYQSYIGGGVACENIIEYLFTADYRTEDTTVQGRPKAAGAAVREEYKTYLKEG